jgi:phosphate transport system permease protein
MQAITLACALLVITPLGLILAQLLKSGLASLSWDWFTNLSKPAQDAGGRLAAALMGTFVLLGLGSIIGVPAGVLGGICLAESGVSRWNGWLRFAADILNGVPSIVWGIVVCGLIVLPMKGYSALAGGVVLGLMMIPLVLRTTEEVLRLVPASYREAGLALGISHWRVTVQIVARTAFKGIITGVLLAIARLAGETAPLLFTAFGNRVWSRRLTDPIAALPLQIFQDASSPSADWHRRAWAGALLLFLVILIIKAAVRVLARGRIPRLP